MTALATINLRFRSTVSWFNRNQWIPKWLIALMVVVTPFISPGSANIPATGSYQNQRVQDITSIVTVTPTSTPPLVANVTATPWPAPSIKVETLGAGGPQRTLTVALRVTNRGPTLITLFGVMFDTDPRQQRLYPQTRVELDPYEDKIYHLVGYFPGACYSPTLLRARSQTGLDNLISWFKDSNSPPRLLHEVTATGDVDSFFQGDPVCP